MTARPSNPRHTPGRKPSPAPTIERRCYVRGLRAERDVANQTCLRRRRNHSHALELLRRRSTWMTIAWPGHPGPFASCGGTYGGGTPRAGKMLITQVAGAIVGWLAE